MYVSACHAVGPHAARHRRRAAAREGVPLMPTGAAARRGPATKAGVADTADAKARGSRITLIA
eukprot:362664-Chlamydomonas_euryale.AAC.1